MQNTFGVKKVQLSKVESYVPGSECMDRLATTRSDTRMLKKGGQLINNCGFRVLFLIF